MHLTHKLSLFLPTTLNFLWVPATNMLHFTKQKAAGQNGRTQPPGCKTEKPRIMDFARNATGRRWAANATGNAGRVS